VGLDEFIQASEGSFVGSLGIFDLDRQESKVTFQDEINLRTTSRSVVVGLVWDT